MRRKVLVIGIGAGNPDYVTIQAVDALKRVNVFFIPNKGIEKEGLARVRREICERFIREQNYRTVEFNVPHRRSAGLSQTETWADPIVGLKGHFSITPEFYLTGWGLIGGGASAELTWDLMGGAGYQFSPSFSAVIGYRAAAVDYENDDFVYDVVQHGPILGAVFRF